MLYGIISSRCLWNGTQNERPVIRTVLPTILSIQPEESQAKNGFIAPHTRFTGFDKMWPTAFGPTKLLWIIVYTICTVLCIIQLNDRVRLYFQYPVSMRISVVRMKEMEYPAIVFCYTNPPFRENRSAYLDRLRWIPPCKSHTNKCNWQKTILNSSLKHSDEDMKRKVNWQKLHKMNKTLSQLRQELIQENELLVEKACADMNFWCAEERQKPYRDYFKARNTTLQYIWSETNIPDRYIALEDSHCNEKDVRACVSLSTTKSIAGSCHVVRKDQPAPYKGDKTYLKITFNDLYSRQYHKISFGVYFQSNGPVNLNSILTTVVDVHPMIHTNVRVSLKKFIMENNTVRPCWDLKSATECTNKCFLNELGMFLNCRLPVMEQAYHLEECPSWENLTVAIQEALDVYYHFDSTKCLCPKSCEDNVYSVMNWEKVESRSLSHMTFTLSFADSLVEEITERLSYKFSALISDVGGNLGIFLGLSILTLMEVLGELLQRAFLSCK